MGALTDAAGGAVPRTVRVDGVEYRRPRGPVGVVCVDGGDPEYFERAVSDGLALDLARFERVGLATRADRVVPSVTGPSNLSLTDVVRHEHPPGSPAADDFMGALDIALGALADAGATVTVTADHGMSAMAHGGRAHGRWIAGVPRAVDGVAGALERDEVCRRFELPADREADVAVIAAPGVALGAVARDPDLSALHGVRLRSHGGTAEACVPFVINAPLEPAYREQADGRLPSRRIFEFAINGAR